ncbi:MAG: peptidyl-prolyl cis-trans isomerase SurA [Chloroflexota bacterium]|nr:peptidyl-prolyl cis-trans isomerase SurA [Chloroflexota bacterium]
MTFKAKPVVKRAQRPSWEGQDRRNLYLNIGFGIVVAAAVVILLIAAGLTWYNDHLSPVGSVDGQSITKDDFRDRYAIESWRLSESERRIRTAIASGQLTDAEGQAQLQNVAQQSQASVLTSVTLERLIDSRLQATLAVGEGVTVTPADIDARLVVEATKPESRHAWVIELKPESDIGAIAPTAAQKAAAKTKADAALKQLQDGKTWEEVAQSVSTDTSTAPQSGDLGWLLADDTQTDEPFLAALLAAKVDTPTDVIEGADGIYRIGRVTEIAAESVDTEYQSKLTADGIDLAKYRTVVQGDVIRQKLQEKLVAQVSGPSPQRHVEEIYIKEPSAAPGADAIKVRHILYSPKNDPGGASALDPSDPAWNAAQEKATATYDKLKVDASQFDSIARAESDEGSARGETGTGGKLPYFDSASSVDAAFLAAILVPGLQPGQLLAPVKSSFGWHVIQVMYRPPDVDWLTALKAKADGGADFAALARDNSEATTAGVGGEVGWIAKGQLDERLTAGIFGATVGSTSSVIAIPGDGIYLFKVLAEETRTPAGRQLTELKSSAFSNWYAEKKAAAVITRDPSLTGTTG